MTRWFVLLLAVLSLTVTTGCHDSEPAPPQGPAGRTVLIYMAAQNSLGQWGNQRRDSMEIAEGSRYIADNNRLLVFMDDATNPRIYIYTRAHKRPQLVRMWPADKCSADPEMLKEVWAWTVANYPAAEYGLVMWSHADGWIPATNTEYTRGRMRPFSFGIDTGTADMGNDARGTQMDIDDMAAAIAAAGVRLRYIFFDACLMQNVEVAYALRNVTDYVVAAPMSIPAAGADYTHQLQAGLFSKDVADIVTTYHADITDPGKTNDYGDYGIVMSAVRTDKLAGLADALRRALPRSEAAGRSSADMAGVLNYQAYTSHYFFRPHNYDMQAALRALLPDGADAEARRALDEAVVAKAATDRFYIGPGYYSYQHVDTDNYSGISMFVPQSVYTENAGRTKLGDLNEAFRRTAWYRDAGWAATEW